MPKVSLCLLTYNRATVLPRTIDSILSQTYRDFELIINDDNSKDETGEVCRRYAAEDSRVRYCCNEKNLRYSGNQNAAIKRSQGDWICFLHDGDIYRPEMLERWMGVAERHPDVGFVFNSQATIEEDGTSIREYQHPYTEYTPGLVFFDYLVGQPSIPIWGILMVRGNLMRSVGPFDRRFPVLADVDMWFRLMLLAPVGYVRETLYAVYPREKGHPNRRVNWAIETEHEAIHLINLRRRFPERGRVFESMLEGVDGMNRKRQLFGLAWCLRNGRLLRLLGGVRHMLGYASRRAALLGREPEEQGVGARRVDWEDRA